MVRNSQEELDKQLSLLLDEYRSGNIKDVHELMKLIDMIYRDWIEFHPEERIKMQRQLYGDLYVNKRKKSNPPPAPRK